MELGDWVYTKAANIGNGSGGRANGRRLGRRRRSRLLLTRGGGRVQQEEKEAETLVRDVPPSGNGVDHSEEFAPVEHPLEPPDIDKPARCPVPEPCIVHDGRIARVAIARRRLDMVKDKDDNALRRRKALSSEHLIHPSRSAPAKVILNLLD